MKSCFFLIISLSVHLAIVDIMLRKLYSKDIKRWPITERSIEVLNDVRLVLPGRNCFQAVVVKEVGLSVPVD